ncbi:MAG: CbtB-domain containing protein [Actinomycetota bacterium]|nr:CbtB-domain containing protein [Actinomycetota bacterium]
MHTHLLSGALAGMSWRIALVAAPALFAVYAVLFEQGALTGGSPLLHEVFHDARHLLGVPCH